MAESNGGRATVVANRFELGRVAGKGGMATVHEARDQATGAIVALKIVDGTFANARFEREASLLARLSHPGIVRYIAHGRIDDDRMYLAMEWLEGTTLDSLLRQGPMSIIDAITVGVRVASALDVAHSAGVVHRDVKPSNIVLRGGRASEAVLVDFGIARVDQASRAMTATGAVVGTPAYMAPEQVRGESKVDARADLFSLGCVLFECLAGHPPFGGEHVIAVLAKILLERAPRIASLRRDTPGALDTLIAELLEKSPEARPANVKRVVAVLEKISMQDTLPAPAEKTVSLGRAEQRLATVLLAQPKPRAMHEADAASDADLAGITVEGLTEVASRFGIDVQRLADGALVGTATGEAGPAAAARIVRAALAFERELDGVAIAIATGRAITAGVIPVGEAIDVAARTVAARARNGGVWICPTTDAMIEGRFDVVHDGGYIRVRSPVAPVRSRDDCCTTGPRCTLLGKTTPFVGRDREIAMLEATFEECADEPVARACIVVAPPGVGKSRLQRELVARIMARREDAAIWIGMADPLTQGAPYAFIADLMRRLFGIVEDEPLAVGQRKIMKRVKTLDVPHAERLARRLGAIAGTPFDDEGDEALRAARRDPLLFAAQATEAFVELVLAASAQCTSSRTMR
jgi:eukaryotic-like serine/threonine-protein kinase